MAEGKQLHFPRLQLAIVNVSIEAQSLFVVVLRLILERRLKGLFKLQEVRFLIDPRQVLTLAQRKMSELEGHQLIHELLLPEKEAQNFLWLGRGLHLPL